MKTPKRSQSSHQARGEQLADEQVALNAGRQIETDGQKPTSLPDDGRRDESNLDNEHAHVITDLADQRPVCVRNDGGSRQRNILDAACGQRALAAKIEIGSSKLMRSSPRRTGA
jgi:hypothetical protein